MPVGSTYLRSAALAESTVTAAMAACTTTQTASRQVDDNEIHAALKARLKRDLAQAVNASASPMPLPSMLRPRAPSTR